MKIFSLIRTLTSTRYLPHRLQNQFIKSQLSDKIYDAVLDVGAGRQRFKKFITCSKYIATDIEDRLGDGSVIIADANKNLPFPDGFFDLVLCTEVLEHLYSPKVALQEICRVLKKDGVLLLTVPFVWNEHEVPIDFYRYTQYGIKKLCLDSGFSKCIANNTNGFWYTYITLLVSRMRNPWLAPVVVILNSIGYIVSLVEGPGLLPLSVHAVIKK